MKIRFSKFAGAFALAWLVSGAAPSIAQAGEASAEPAIAEAAPDLSFEEENQSVFSLPLTDSDDAFKARLWAAHLLESSPRGPIVPGDLDGISGLQMTGPRQERSVGIQLEFNF